MFDVGGMEIIALIAVALVAIALVAAFLASARKKRQLRDLSRSSDFRAVYDEKDDGGSGT